MIADINKDVASSKLISFADDTRLYNQISDTEDCDSLQRDLNSVYKWASENNIFFNSIRSGGGGLPPPHLRFFALMHLILELQYCALGTFLKT